MFASLLGAVLIACLAQLALAIPAISVNGAKFFADGQQFFIKGVAYQGTPSDPLIDTNQCQLDAKSMQAIGTNSIRVYHVDPYSSHDGCMSAFSNAGIYVWLDLDTFNTTVEQANPQWTEDQFLAFAEVMDVFQGYDNLAGFWIGNEVINTADGSPAAPYVKAATTDMKSYMAAKKYRQIPIGYSAADIAELRPMLQNYLACGSNPNQIIDFFGLNSYEWCGDATYQTSGYVNLQAMSEGYNIPIFFSETGCNVGGERTFNDQDAIFGPDMVNTWSGSIIYEWVQEANDYGLVTYPNGQIYNGAPIPIQPDYNNLAGQWKTITPSGVAEANYSPSNSPPACPSATLGWQVNGDVPLPTLGAGIVQAAAATVKPTSTPRPTTSSTSIPTTTSSPSGTITTSYTAEALSLQLYPSVSPGLKETTTSSTLTTTADSVSQSSASSQLSGTNKAQNDAASSPTTTSPAPSATTSHSAASKQLQVHPIATLWALYERCFGVGGEIGFVIVVTIMCGAGMAFL